MASADKQDKSGRQIHIRLTPDTHRRLRIRAAEADMTIQQWVEAAIERELGRQSRGKGKQ